VLVAVAVVVLQIAGELLAPEELEVVAMVVIVVLEDQETQTQVVVAAAVGRWEELSTTAGLAALV
jgi:hypothetical protein